MLPTARLRKWFHTKDGFIDERLRDCNRDSRSAKCRWTDGPPLLTGPAFLKKRQSVDRRGARSAELNRLWTLGQSRGGGDGSASKSLLSPCLSRKPSGILGKRAAAALLKKIKYIYIKKIQTCRFHNETSILFFGGERGCFIKKILFCFNFFVFFHKQKPEMQMRV